MTHPAPDVVNHEASCESAADRTCICSCISLLHQCDVLDAALASRRPPKSDMSKTLRSLFGSQFRDFLDPAPTETTRRPWTPLSTGPGPKKTASQQEQRAVDVCLHDVLARVHSLAPASGQWLDLGNRLRARTRWAGVAADVAAAMSASGVATDKRTRGYFWTAMLASAGALLDAGNSTPSAGQIAWIAMRPATVAAGTVDPLPAAVPWAARVAFPRKRVASVIRESTVPAAVEVAANVITEALRTSTLSAHEHLVIIGTVGITICPDLWKSPAAVHYLLLPTLRTLRAHFGSTFSLDSPGQPAEDVIAEVLGEKWESWGNRGGLW